MTKAWKTMLTAIDSRLASVATPVELEFESELTTTLATAIARVMSTQGNGLFLKSCHPELRASVADTFPDPTATPPGPCGGYAVAPAGSP